MASGKLDGPRLAEWTKGTGAGSDNDGAHVQTERLKRARHHRPKKGRGTVPTSPGGRDSEATPE